KGTKAMTATNGFNVKNWHSIKRYLDSVTNPKDLLLLKQTFRSSKRLGMASTAIDWVLIERGYTYSALVDQCLLD
ncbi:hypothetical protein, partial [Klebsiella quasipneumoniae]|uniref:hypothetical protein n=1 Tax=Klebsiella quasipneumoniae TaxID=1463165 RepID=UPI0020044406